MNLQKYKNIDDYIEKNRFEVMTFSNLVVTRFAYNVQYKKNGYKITEKRYKQITGRNYEELTLLLKKEIKLLNSFPIIYLIGGLISFGGILSFEDIGMSFVALFWFGAATYFFVTKLIEYLNILELVNSKSIITRDIVFPYFSLFSDEIDKIQNKNPE
jgi:hypothetical protein